MTFDNGGPAGRPTPRAAVALRRLLSRRATARDPELDADLDFARMSRAGYRVRGVPDQTEAAADLAARVRRLAASGALDEGSGDVFDALIDAWSQHWENQLSAEHDARVSYLRYREVFADAEATRLDRLAQWARSELRETEQRIGDLRRRLGDAPAPDHPPQDQTDEPQGSETREQA